MFHLLGLLFIFIIAILILGLSIVVTIVRNILGLGRRRSAASQPYQQARTTRTDATTDEGTVTAEEGELRPRRKKLFDKDEGEYVDFEEIKE